MLTRVAVLRGGPSAEHDSSLKTGMRVLRELEQHKSSAYQALDIFIDRAGVWHVRGVPTTPERALVHADVVWNALHGTYGEDGEVQRILDRVGVPYTGSGAYASSVGMNKATAKAIVNASGVKTPKARTLSVSETLPRDIVYLFRELLLPVVIKPVGSGSSLGVTLARSFAQFEEGIKRAFSFSPQVLLEEFIDGKEATCGVVEYLRDTPLYSLPPIEIVVPKSVGIFTSGLKEDSSECSTCPGSFTAREVAELRSAAEAVHRNLGLRHYSRSDFIVSPRGVYFLEVNTLPGLSEQSLLPKALSAVGVPFSEFVPHVIDLARQKR